MNIFLWVLQALLALAFLAHGLLLVFPPAAVVEQMNAALPRWFQLFIGVAELIAAVGLTLPGVTRIQTWLVPAAGGGLMIVMVGPRIFPLGGVEWSSGIPPAGLLVIAPFVAYRRWRVLPIRSRVSVA